MRDRLREKLVDRDAIAAHKERPLGPESGREGADAGMGLWRASAFHFDRHEAPARSDHEIDLRAALTPVVERALARGGSVGQVRAPSPANLRVLEIEEIKSVPYAPVSHPFVERLIGTIRREYLDRVFFWNTVDLARKLGEFKQYYNAYRVHRSLDGSTPAQRAGAPSPAPASLDRHAWRQHCHGLFQTPFAA
ncbi:MAG TPA: integrase core domain-containing protein [Casimicrobiaceae bacterium]